MTALRKHDHLAYRVRILPEQLERAYARVEQLEAEARAFGFLDLIRAERDLNACALGVEQELTDEQRLALQQAERSA